MFKCHQGQTSTAELQLLEDAIPALCSSWSAWHLHLMSLVATALTRVFDAQRMRVLSRSLASDSWQPHRL